MSRQGGGKRAGGNEPSAWGASKVDASAYSPHPEPKAATRPGGMRSLASRSLKHCSAGFEHDCVLYLARPCVGGAHGQGLV